MGPTNNFNPFENFEPGQMFGTVNPAPAAGSPFIVTTSTTTSDGLAMYSTAHPGARGQEQAIAYHNYNCTECGHPNKHYNNQENNFCELCNNEHNINHGY